VSAFVSTAATRSFVVTSSLFRLASVASMSSLCSRSMISDAELMSAVNVDGALGDVRVVGLPVDRQRRRRRIDVVDLEVARAGDPLRRQAHAQAAVDLHLRVLRIRDVARRRAAAEEPRLDLRLDEYVARALGHRPVELVFVVGEPDPGHFADRHTAVLELRAEVESLHRFVEVRLDRELGLEPAAGADHDEHDRAGDDRADHEQPELEVVRFESHRDSARRQRPPARLRAGRTPGRAGPSSRRADGGDRPRR
jgi:hypothetical protein